jgi:hypothetical protein
MSDATSYAATFNPLLVQTETAKGKPIVLSLADCYLSQPEALSEFPELRNGSDWLVVRPYGVLTVQQELFCWRLAKHGSRNRAWRETTQGKGQPPHRASDRARKLLMRAAVPMRVKELQDLHKEGVIDLIDDDFVRNVYGERIASYNLNEAKNPPRVSLRGIAEVQAGAPVEALTRSDKS